MLPCAGVAAWNSLDAFEHVPKNAGASFQGGSQFEYVK
jgi:hypothetical protein